MTRHIKKLVVAAATLLALAGTASASELTVDMPVLTASVQGDDLRVDYRFGQGSWRQVQRYGISPVLNVYVAQRSGQYARVVSAPLMQQDGRLSFADHTRLHGYGQIRLEVAGNRWGHSIASRPVYQPIYEQPAPVYGPVVTETLDSLERACAQATSARRYEANCVARAQTLALSAQTVGTCGHATDSDTGFFSCLDQAPILGHRAPEVILACNTTFDGDANLTACMRSSRTNPYAARDILECRQEENRYDNRFACIENSNPRPVVVTPARPVYTTPVYTAPRPVYTRPAPRQPTYQGGARASWSVSGRLTF